MRSPRPHASPAGRSGRNGRSSRYSHDYPFASSSVGQSRDSMWKGRRSSRIVRNPCLLFVATASREGFMNADHSTVCHVTTPQGRSRAGRRSRVSRSAASSPSSAAASPTRPRQPSASPASARRRTGVRIERTRAGRRAASASASSGDSAARTSAPRSSSRPTHATTAKSPTAPTAFASWGPAVATSATTGLQAWITSACERSSHSDRQAAVRSSPWTQRSS